MRVIENPVSGERIVIRRSARETDGALLSFDLYLPPGKHVPASHVHPSQEEVFTVITGEMHFRIGRRHLIARAGDSVRVPSRTSHWFGNRSMQTAHAYVEARPALRLEELFVANEAMQCHTLGGRRVPHITALAAALLDYHAEVRAPLIPTWLVRVILAVPARLGRKHATSRQIECAPHS
ncbi:MAG TPA: cupin domain-containing protein [Candidatus Dormibacteraeota bacterium]